MGIRTHQLLPLVALLLLAGGHDVDDAPLPVAPSASAALDVTDGRSIRVVAQHQIHLQITFTQNCIPRALFIHFFFSYLQEI